MQEFKCFILISLGYFTVVPSGKVLGREVFINWTRSDIAHFKPDTPLNVTLGDELLINCVNGEYSTLYLLTDRRQYDMCRCNAIEAGCAANQLISRTCYPEIDLQIPFSAGEESRAFNYVPERTYYLVSFPDGTKEGGPCLPTDTEPGMRMAIAVMAPRVVQKCRGTRHLDAARIPPPPATALMYASSSLNPTIQQVLIITEPVNCSGWITSWNGLAIALNLPSSSNHVLNISVWRPRMMSGGLRYSYVGSNRLLFEPEELQNSANVMHIDQPSGSVTERISYFRFIEKKPGLDEMIYIQRGDVVGWIIGPRTDQSLPLSLVFRNSTDEQYVDIERLVYNISVCQICSFFECSTYNRFTGVIPYLSFNYRTFTSRYSYLEDDLRNAQPVVCNINGSVPTQYPVGSPLTPTGAAAVCLFFRCQTDGLVIYTAPAGSIVFLLVLVLSVSVLVILIYKGSKSKGNDVSTPSREGSIIGRDKNDLNDTISRLDSSGSSNYITYVLSSSADVKV